ncbi:ATP-binding response regulator [Methanococcoides burtonii]|uniref:histidine kinase n=1 Tax=Methanococcoides burtonii (strain DSM 6242 / NBRC 107633 / OCM 468 / ACE-M) TaxID=259564 RepID=Q12TG1_METBU|nr:ATP-binding protein [Methanococcoides burtonii]ABE53265.1 HATPase domain-containing multisensor signal transduction histidine kinase [Methanococcoides burtonii DSM 6242]
MKIGEDDQNREIRPKILIAEADEKDAEALVSHLSPNYDIIRAVNGNEAVIITKEKHPDLVLLNSTLPEIDGYEVCRLLKRDESNKVLPVIMITSITDEDEKTKAIESKADDLLVRPVDILELTTRVRSLLRMKELHDQLVKEKDQAQKYVDVAGSIIGVISKDLKVTLVNQKACDVLGYEKDEIIGKNWFDAFLPGYVRERIKEGYIGVIEGKLEPPEYSEKPILNKTNEERLIFWHDVVLRDKDNNIIGTISSGDDITERKIAEKAMEEANRELELLDNIKDQFLTNLTHELRTPLISIKGFTELMLEDHMGPINDAQKNAIHTVLRNSERLRHLVESLLYVSGEHTKNIKYNMDVLSLTKITEEILETFTAPILKKGLTIERNIQTDLPTILGDKDHLKRMINHLLDNAIKFTPEGGKIGISALHDSESVIINIEDTGIGIPEELLPNIFSRFYQVDGSTRRKYGGTGVGLHICKKIIEAHKGSLSVSSKIGEGTIISVKLPI